MPNLTAAERQMRATIAARRRHHPDDPAIERLERDYKASRLESAIRAAVESAPQLSIEQREELARILRPARSAAPVMPTAEDFAAEMVAATLAPAPGMALDVDDIDDEAAAERWDVA